MRDPERESGTPPDVLSEEERVLAAVERAARHRTANTAAVASWTIVEHLGIPKRSADARRARSQLERLLGAGTLECSRNHGVLTWALTDAGRRRLQAARLAGRAPQLPESPQHLTWRSARTSAEQEIERFRQRLGEALSEAVQLLGSDSPAHSDTWFELGQRLRRDCRRLGSASHCLYEWSEPHDGWADVDERREPADEAFAPELRAHRRALRAGRRNTHLWDEPD